MYKCFAILDSVKKCALNLANELCTVIEIVIGPSETNSPPFYCTFKQTESQFYLVLKTLTGLP